MTKGRGLRKKRMGVALDGVKEASIVTKECLIILCKEILYKCEREMVLSKTNHFSISIDKI